MHALASLENLQKHCSDMLDFPQYLVHYEVKSSLNVKRLSGWGFFVLLLFFGFFQDEMFTFLAFAQFSRLSRFLSGRILHFFSTPCSPHNYLKCFVFSHTGPTSDLNQTGLNLPALMELLLIQFTLARNHSMILYRDLLDISFLIVLHNAFIFLTGPPTPNPHPSKSPTIGQSSHHSLKGDKETASGSQEEDAAWALTFHSIFPHRLWLSSAARIRRQRSLAPNLFLLMFTLS